MTITTNQPYTYEATLIRVVDGDTLIVDIDCGFHIHYHAILRLLHVNAPEANTKQGRTVTRKLTRLLAQHQKLTVHTHRQDRYGRYLAIIEANGLNINNIARSWSNGLCFSRRRRRSAENTG